MNGSEYFTSNFSRIRAGTWVDVFIQASPDGNVSVMYDGNWIYTNANSVRLGLAFGCGNTFYGETTGSPDPGILPDYFLVRWHGQVQPLYSQTYTLYTRSDDGARLWVNGQLLVDAWKLQGPTEFSGTISLVANQKYDLMMEYYENAGGAVAQLSWSSPNQVKEIIPMTQLYPGATALPRPVLTSGLANGTNLLLNWSGTFRLESAVNVLGPWAPVAGGTLSSPYSNNIGTNPQMFFRLLYPMTP